MKRTIACLLAAVALTAGTPLNAQAQPFANMPQLPVDPQVRKGTLPNGLTYYIRHNEWPEQRACFYIAQNVGSMQEEDHQRGLAHFLEHICFNGTTHFPGNSLKTYLESIGVKFGADLNAYTAFDQTVYNIDNVPTTRETTIDSCLLILHDWSHDLLLLDEEIDKERGVINEEWRLRRSASQRLYEAALPEIYPDSKYGQRMPIGTMEVVMNFPYDDLRDYYKAWYRPDLQAIIVVGDVDVDSIEEKIKQRFADIPAPPDNAPQRIEYEVPDNTLPLIAIHADAEMTTSQIMLMQKHDILPRELRNTTLYYAYHYMAQAMEQMFDCRIQELLQQSEPPFIHAGMGDGQFFVAKTKDALTAVALFKDNGQEEALTALYREMLRAKRHGFSSAEYERFKQDYLANLEKQYARRDKVLSSNYVQEYVGNFTDDEPIPGIENEYEMMQQLVEMIPVGAINELADGLIGESDSNLVIVLFTPEKEDISLPRPEDLLAVLHQVRGEDIEPYAEEVSDDPLIDHELSPASTLSIEDEPFDTQCITLDNGIRIHAKITDFTPNSISMQAISYGGTALYSDDDYLNASHADIVGIGGWGNFAATDLTKRLAGTEASAEPYIGSHAEGLSGACVTKDLETMLQLTHLCFTAPRRDDEAYASYINRQTEMLRNAELRPTTALQDTLANVLYAGNLRHQRTRSNDLQNLDYDRIIDIYKERFADANDFEFFFVGDFNIDSAVPLFEKYLGTLPTLPSQETRQDDGSRLRDGTCTTLFEKEQQTPSAMVIYLYHKHIEENNLHNRLLASMLGQLLQRVYTESVREDEGGAYGVPTFGGINEEWPELYAQLIIQLPTAPEKRERMMEIIQQGIDDMCDNGPTEENLQKIKEYLHRSHAENLKKNNFWMNAMQALARDGQDYVTGYDEAVDLISADDIKAFANQVLRSGNCLIVGMTTPIE